MKRLSGFWIPSAATFLAVGMSGLAVPPDQVKIKRAQARALFETDRARDPKVGNGYRRLLEMYEDKPEYTAAEVKIARDGWYKPDSGRIDRGREQNGNAPPGTWSRNTVKDRLAALEAIDPSKKGLFARLVERVGCWEWYTTAQVDNAENFEDTSDLQGEDPLVAAAYQKASDRGRKGQAERKPIARFPRIRRDWRDVLYEEDPTPGDNKDAAFGDLEGAQFSFTHDGVAQSDTWAAQAALIFPFIGRCKQSTDPHLSLRQWAVAPSITYNRVTTNGDPSEEVDSMFHRVGVFLDFSGSWHRPPQPGEMRLSDGRRNPANEWGGGYAWQVRAAAVELTDHGLHAGLRGGELDIEPRFISETFSLGYRSLLWPKYPTMADESDQAYLDCQLRFWLHAEGGEIEDAAESWLPYTGSFFRLGPTVQFQLRAPALSGGRVLSLTTIYSYLTALAGPGARPSYFRATLAYDLVHDEELNHKISLNASYERGGQNFTKQETDGFTISLGVLF